MDESDYTGQLETQFKHIIKKSLVVYAPDYNNARYTDMSQSYSLKIPLLSSLPKGTEPRYLIIVRNPYAMCWRELVRHPNGHKYWNRKLDKKKQLQIYCEHWNTTFEIALDDARTLNKKRDYKMFKAVRFEDILTECKPVMRNVFDFLNLSFDLDYIPQPHHRLPLGSIGRKKWHPLRPDVNEKYLTEIPEWAIEMISSECGDLIDVFDYFPS